jgi:hypothetical protein
MESLDMPSRLACLAILLYWAVAASSLIRRDILPELRFVRPPDLRSIARAGGTDGPTRWSVLVVDHPSVPEGQRTVGEALTESVRTADGWVRMKSRVKFDSGSVVRGTNLAAQAGVEMAIESTCTIDASGNLSSFCATVATAADLDPVLRVDGHVKDQGIEVTTHGPLPILNQTRILPYQPRSLVQNALDPFDRLPGLQVGQHWETRVVNPLNGQVQAVRVEVARKTAIIWDKKEVTVLEVVQHLAPFSARTWVDLDGLVLRQEVPFPFVKLVLERQPERSRVERIEGPHR